VIGVQNIGLSWQQAAVLTAGLSAAAVATWRLAPATGTGWRRRTALPLLRESALLAGLYSLWQLAGSLSVLGTGGAFSRANDLVRIEDDLHLPSEASVQRLVTGHPVLTQACNLYYATMHFGVLFVFLAWLFLRHRAVYGRWRRTLVLLTAGCLLLQLIPVAPPRLLPGYVDTAAQYGQSVYGLGLSTDQLSAMPSVHVGWAVLIAWVVVRTSRSRWRWLAIVHPVATTFVVVATANHFWLDGVGAVAVLIGCAWLQYGTRSATARWRWNHRAVDELSANPDQVLAAPRMK
jgi:PAP2 superfamily protein